MPYAYELPVPSVFAVPFSQVNNCGWFFPSNEGKNCFLFLRCFPPTVESAEDPLLFCKDITPNRWNVNQTVRLRRYILFQKCAEGPPEQCQYRYRISSDNRFFCDGACDIFERLRTMWSPYGWAETLYGFILSWFCPWKEGQPSRLHTNRGRCVMQ